MIEELGREVAHIVRNRFTVIGGFTRRLRKILREPEARQAAEIILEEVEKGVEASEHWLKTHEPGPI